MKNVSEALHQCRSDAKRSPEAEDLLPKLHQTESGKPRRVGVEIEFGGLDIDTAARLVAATFGGNIVPETEYETLVRDSTAGEFQIELDVGILKRAAQARKEQDAAPGPLEQLSEQALAAFLQQVAPCEIVTPPLPLDRIAELDRLVGDLAAAGARGTNDAWIYAFGIHFNPQAPSLHPDSILAYLRAFVLLYDWLKAVLQIDTSRRLTPFIKPFPGRYVESILQADYQPAQAQLIDDYLADNPTRNRALDMLPLFAHLDSERVMAGVDEAQQKAIKSRPTYHYRLANSRVGDPAWRLTDEWCYWLVIEALAQDSDRLQAMAADYLDRARRPFTAILTSWPERTRQWLEQP